MAFPNLLKRLFDTDGAGVKLRGDIMPYSTAAPKAGGTASAGTSNTVARGDHVHPAQTIGTASGTVSGTTKLSDAIDSTSGADSGVAATPKAVKAAYDKAVEAKSAAEATSSIDPWNIFPMRVPIAVDGVTFGGSDGRRAIMPGETEAREGWILCDGGSDGKGGTVPDLRGRMILGASDEHTAGSTGGSETHSHSISGTVGETTLTEAQLASHKHYVSRNKDLNDANENEGSTGYHDTVGNYSSSSWNYTTSSTGSSGTHTHPLSGVKSGSASNLPPYFAMPFVTRIA